ncbi:hypothetical protein Agub_g8507 [Astrephomene gubernaculifera]|uniref:Uncharacterized protein n=1 Tax=Astrephomene gubernaculifera TaxID=47775 RepID=A0AAD3HNA9_9CHLO|nr:hypothetical protein Agub_g8507 [Astrephomene gubernaculifera]
MDLLQAVSLAAVFTVSGLALQKRRRARNKRKQPKTSPCGAVASKPTVKLMAGCSSSLRSWDLADAPYREAEDAAEDDSFYLPMPPVMDAQDGLRTPCGLHTPTWSRPTAHCCSSPTATPPSPRHGLRHLHEASFYDDHDHDGDFLLQQAYDSCCEPADVDAALASTDAVAAAAAAASADGVVVLVQRLGQTPGKAAAAEAAALDDSVYSCTSAPLPLPTTLSDGGVVPVAAEAAATGAAASTEGDIDDDIGEYDQEGNGDGDAEVVDKGVSVSATPQRSSSSAGATRDPCRGANGPSVPAADGNDEAVAPAAVVEDDTLAGGVASDSNCLRAAAAAAPSPDGDAAHESPSEDTLAAASIWASVAAAAAADATSTTDAQSVIPIDVAAAPAATTTSDIDLDGAAEAAAVAMTGPEDVDEATEGCEQQLLSSPVIHSRTKRLGVRPLTPPVSLLTPAATAAAAGDSESLCHSPTVTTGARSQPFRSYLSQSMSYFSPSAAPPPSLPRPPPSPISTLRSTGRNLYGDSANNDCSGNCGNSAGSNAGARLSVGGRSSSGGGGGGGISAASAVVSLRGAARVANASRLVPSPSVRARAAEYEEQFRSSLCVSQAGPTGHLTSPSPARSRSLVSCSLSWVDTLTISSGGTSNSGSNTGGSNGGGNGACSMGNSRCQSPCVTPRAERCEELTTEADEDLLEEGCDGGGGANSGGSGTKGFLAVARASLQDPLSTARRTAKPNLPPIAGL